MLTVDLHPYQAPAVEMLLERESLLIAMEMGLGKTITTLAAAEHLLGEGEVSTVLIVAPSGLLTQWAESIAANTDVTTKLIKVKGETIAVPDEQWCVVIAGTPEKKRALIEGIERTPPQYVIASYDTVAEHLVLLRKVSQMAVVDEVTVLKGFKAARGKRLRKLRVRFRVGLSGAPVENHRPEEAWAIMRWIDPELFGDYVIFEQAYIRRNIRTGRPTHYVNVDVLNRKLSTAMYRKRTTDPDVVGFVPVVDRAVWQVNLDPQTRVVYGQIIRDLDAELHKLGPSGKFDTDAYYGGRDESSGAGRVMAIHQVAQMLLDHPDLVRKSAQTFVLSGKSGSAYAAALMSSGRLDDLVATPKLDLLHTEVTRILRSDKIAKVIVVSGYRGMQPLIAERFEGHGIVHYHGGLNHAGKAAAVSKFETDPQVRIMIMSHAGAYGVDLPAGTHLIQYDPPRSSGQGRQLDGRHVRASSVHQRVMVIHLVTQDTIEARTFELLDLKSRVSDAVTDGDGLDEFGTIKNNVSSLTRHVAEALATSA